MNQPYGATPQEARKLFSRIGLAFFCMLGLYIALGVFILPGLIVWLAPSLLSRGWVVWALNYLPLYGIGFPVFILILRTIPDSYLPALPEPKATIGFGGMVKLLFSSLAVMIGLNLFSQLLARIIEMFSGITPTDTLNGLSGMNDLLVSMLVLVLVAPWMEELVFRLLTYKKLIRYGGKVYILFTATFFALFHLNIYQLFYAFGLGLILGAMMYYTGNWLYGVILHMLVNFIGSVPSLLIQTYGTQTLLAAWGFVMIGIAVVGLIILASWLTRNWRNIRFAPPEVLLPKGSVLRNVGVPLALALMLLMLGVLTFLL